MHHKILVRAKMMYKQLSEKNISNARIMDMVYLRKYFSSVSTELDEI